MKSLKLPIQSVPVVRTIAGAPMSSGDGIEASGFWDIAKKLGGAAVKYGPGIVGALGGI